MYRMNFTWNAPVTSRYGTTQHSNSTSICAFLDLTGNVASSATSDMPAAATTAIVLYDTSSIAAGNPHPTIRYATPSFHGIPRSDTYSSPAHATMPSGSPYPHTASCLM